MKLSYKHTAIAAYGGFFSQAIVCNLAPLFFVFFKDEMGLSTEQLGRLILFNFVSQIFADIIATKFGDKWGFRKGAVFAHFFCVIGLISMGILPMIVPFRYAALLCSVVLYAIGGGFIEVIVSPIIDTLPGEEKEKAMALGHSFYCWGQMTVVLITATLIKIFGYGKWYLFPILWAVIPALNLILFCKVPLKDTIEVEKVTSTKTLFKTRLFIVSMVMMVAAGSAELSMSQWASYFAEIGLGVDKFMGDLLGPCLFALFQAIGRTWYGLYGEKTDLIKALTYTCFMCVICYLVTALSPIKWLSLVACALTGFSVALMWPGTIAMSAKQFPNGGTKMFGIFAICGDLGCSFGPWITGFVSDCVANTELNQAFSLTKDELGLKAGLLAATVLPIIMLGCAVLFKRWKAPNSAK